LRREEERTEKGREELKKLKQRGQLSPMSQKRKFYLEKWVNRRVEKFEDKKKQFQTNLNSLMSKIEQDKENTKKKIGSKRKGNMIFNNSVEWSHHDQSLGQLTTSSINTTPRITKPPEVILPQLSAK